MQRYKGIIEYYGANYSGMQKQEGLQTVQGVLEDALQKFTAGETKVIDYCGRTDAGVHAFGQVIHFDILNRNENQILKGLNYFLVNSGVIIKSIEKVDAAFHSRFSCKGREYKYYIYNSQFKSPIMEGRTHHVSHKLNIELMQQATRLLTGEHNFSSLRGKHCQALSPIKTVDFINIKRITGEIIEIHIGAKSFLYKMVRNITGLLISIGCEKLHISDIQRILEAQNISALPYTAPACGLYFWRAVY